MRVSKSKAAENREKILKAASRIIRERGILGAGVDALTEAAGMTHGSLYSQFGSKERLVGEALGHAIAESRKTTSGTASFDRYVAAYLSNAHRDQVGQGCPLAALACEMPRQSRDVREAFTVGLKGMLGRLRELIGEGSKRGKRDEQALAAVASMVGALVLARAVTDTELSDEILRATRKQLAIR